MEHIPIFKENICLPLTKDQWVTVIILNNSQVRRDDYDKIFGVPTTKKKSKEQNVANKTRVTFGADLFKMHVILEKCLLNNVGELCLNSAFEDGADSMKNDPAEMRPA